MLKSIFFFFDSNLRYRNRNNVQFNKSYIHDSNNLQNSLYHFAKIKILKYIKFKKTLVMKESEQNLVHENEDEE